MPYRERLEKFRQANDKLAFACIANKTREVFANELERRAIDPRLIHQGGTPLCGPASFIFCVAREYREAYVNYVLDLAEKGSGKLGNLTVKPSSACRNANDSLIGIVDPVDWVALASLRDSSNNFLPMSNPKSTTAGITSAAQLAAWFTKTGWFSGVDHSFFRSLFQGSLKHFLDINNHGHAYICLLINSAIINGDSSVDKVPSTPNHWVVLDGRVSIGQEEFFWANMSKQKREELLHKPLRLKFWTWGGESLSEGKPCCSIDDRNPDITLARFLSYYYGYVSATIK